MLTIRRDHSTQWNVRNLKSVQEEQNTMEFGVIIS